MSKYKQTQGNKKINQLINSLRRNSYFVRSIKKLVGYLNEKDKVMIEREKQEGNITDRLCKLDDDTESILKAIIKADSKFDKLIRKIEIQYGLDPELFSDSIINYILKGEKDINVGEIYDMCRINDYYDESLNPIFGYPLPIRLDKTKRTEIEVYPIHLEIHKFASKRDILDFIDKRWEIIESHLETYRGEKKVRIRKRKIDRELVDYIWENRKKTIKEIKKVLDTIFPDNNLIYNEISKIISIEKSRRNRKINVGQ